MNNDYTIEDFDLGKMLRACAPNYYKHSISPSVRQLMLDEYHYMTEVEFNILLGQVRNSFVSPPRMDVE